MDIRRNSNFLKSFAGGFGKLLTARKKDKKKEAITEMGRTFPFLIPTVKKIDSKNLKRKEAPVAPAPEPAVEETEEEKLRKRKSSRARTLMSSSGDTGMAMVGRSVLLGG